MADDRWRDDDRRRWEEEHRRYGAGDYGWAGPAGPGHERGRYGGGYGYGQDFGRRYGVAERWHRGYPGPGEPWGGGYGHGYMGYGADWGPYGPGWTTRGYWGGYGPGTRGYQGRGYGPDWRGGWGPGAGGWGYEGSYGGDWRQGHERGLWDRMSDEVSSWFGDEEAERRRRMDQARGGHYGRGPRGYTRSDDRIKEEVCDRLTDDWLVDASDMEISVAQCEVTLDGTAASREERRRAEDIAESVSGVRHVQNNLRVAHGETAPRTTGITGQAGRTGTTRATETTPAARSGTSRSR